MPSLPLLRGQTTWQSTPTRNSWFSLSTPPGSSATLSARKPAQSGHRRGYLNLAAEGQFEEGYILSREPDPVAAMCAYVCSAPCERACRRGEIDRPLATRAMKRFLVEWHQASGIPDDMPQIDAARHDRGRRRRRSCRRRGRARAGHRRTPGHGLRRAALRRRHDAHRRPRLPPPRQAIEMDLKLVERLGVRFRYGVRIGRDITFEQLMEDYDGIADLRRRDGRGTAGRARWRPQRHSVRRGLHEARQPG